MDKQIAILRLASDLFDVAGAVGNILIVGLETRRDQDLDEFATDGEHYKFVGFHQHFGLKVRALIQQIAALGNTAKQLQYSGDISIKRLAVIAGLGGWGKNSLVIHPKFGPRLRFVALELNLTFAAETHDARTMFPGCAKCDACIRACQLNLLRPFELTKKEKCLAYLDLSNPQAIKRCDLCQIACPH